jgi:Lysine methyltransferase
MSSASFRDRLAAIQAKKSLDVHASSHGPSSWEREIARGAAVGTGCGDDVFRFELAHDSTVTSPTLMIRESHSDIGCRVWDGGVFLARQLMWLVNAGLLNFTGKTVLELGSGTGIVGLTCAYLNANHVILTDLPRVTPNLANIVETNAHIQIPGSTDAIGDR